MTREEAIDILRSYLMFDKSNMQIDIALNMAIEALKILGEDGIVNCCGCIYWNEYGFCNLTDKHREDFDYCSDGRREP